MSPSKTFYRDSSWSYMPVQMAPGDSLQVSSTVTFTVDNGHGGKEDIEHTLCYGTINNESDENWTFNKALYGYSITLEPRFAVVGGNGKTMIIGHKKKRTVKELEIGLLDLDRVNTP